MVLAVATRAGFAGAVGLVVVAASWGCSAPSPTTPSPPTALNYPAGTVFSVVSGEDDRPVHGAAVRLVGHGLSGVALDLLLQTNALGQVVTDRPILYEPTPEIDITAQGFLKRETMVRSPEERTFSLWPTTSPTGLDEQFSALLVYSTSRCPAQIDLRTLRRHHPMTTEVKVVRDSSLQTAFDETVHQNALDALNAATQNRPRYTLADSAVDGQVSVFVRADPTYGACPSGNFAAYTILSGADRNITGAQINYCSLDWARNPAIVAHELGHSFGLNHSGDPSADVMGCALGAREYSPREVLAMRLLLQRPANNAWPDRDRSILTSLATVEVTPTVFACPRPPR